MLKIVLGASCPGKVAAICRWLFAQCYDVLAAPLMWSLARRRRLLLREAVDGEGKNKLLEIGAGTGANLVYVPTDVAWVGIEPNPHMAKRLRRRWPAREVIEGLAEHLPFADGSFDVCIATLVFCSVRDLEKSIAETHRVLRPGGKLIFLEHVRAPTGAWARCFQRRLCRPWACFADGCQLDRDTQGAISRRYTIMKLETYWAPWWTAPCWVAYQIAGVAVKES